MQKILRYAIALLIMSPLFNLPVDAKSSGQHLLPKSKLELNLELSNESFTPYRNRLVSLTDTALAEYTKLFGGLPKKLDGSLYDSLTIKLSSGLGGEADPEFIDLRVSDMELFGFYNWEVGLLHEILHLWSAETFLYVDDQEQWFNEGVTEYLTFRLAARLGIIEKQDVLNVFSNTIGTYLSAKGIGEHSLRSAGSTDELKQEHYFLIYRGGFVAGMVLDHQIRSKSGGKYSLDDLMAELYKSHSREKPYSSDSILLLAKTSMGLDFSDFFKEHIYGNRIIPVGHYFDMGELIFSRAGGRTLSEDRQTVLSEMLTFQ